MLPLWVSQYAAFLLLTSCRGWHVRCVSVLESKSLLFVYPHRFTCWCTVPTGMWELTAAESCAGPFGWGVLWPGVQDSTGLNSAPRQCMLRREYKCNADTCTGGLVYHWQSADACQQEQHLACNPESTGERWCSWHTAATEVSGGLTCSELGHVAFRYMKQHISLLV